ncbi:MAG: hypothetical protein HY652_04320 [Acidobacteria bacterium]|nr:hypothetical protein [Acidobacteriota bacterium]
MLLLTVHTPVPGDHPLGSAPGGPLGQWQTLRPLPLAQQEVGVAQAGGKIYAAGGFDEDRQATDRVQI